MHNNNTNNNKEEEEEEEEEKEEEGRKEGKLACLLGTAKILRRTLDTQDYRT